MQPPSAMNEQEATQLAQLIDLLRAKGVQSFDGLGVKLEFGPVPEAVPAATAPKADPDMCRCGHPNYAHVNGLCVTGGCEPEKCVEAEKVTHGA